MPHSCNRLPWVEVGSHVFGSGVDCFMQSSVVCLLCHSWSDTVCVLCTAYVFLPQLPSSNVRLQY
jgi:hypothetical protein